MAAQQHNSCSWAFVSNERELLNEQLTHTHPYTQEDAHTHSTVGQRSLHHGVFFFKLSIFSALVAFLQLSALCSSVCQTEKRVSVCSPASVDVNMKTFSHF